MSRPATDTEPRLFDCALSLFSENGYAATSVREIIEAVGLTKPVLYYYCENKADLFAKLVDRIHREALEGLDRLVADSGQRVAERLRAMIRGSFAFCRADPRVPRLMFQASFGAELNEIAPVLRAHQDHRFELVCRLMAEGMRTGEISGDPDDSGHVAARAIAFCALMDYPISVFSRSPASAETLTPELADSLHDVFLNGAHG